MIVSWITDSHEEGLLRQAMHAHCRVILYDFHRSLELDTYEVPYAYSACRYD